MNQDIDLKEEEFPFNTYYLDIFLNNHYNDLYSYSKGNIEKSNEYFESEFKKVFSTQDAFGQLKEEEEEKEEDKKNIESLSEINRKKLRYIHRFKKHVNKKSKLKHKNVLSILKKNNFKNSSFDDIIILLKKLNKESNSNIPILDKFNLLKIESRLISELKNRIIYNLNNEN